MRSFQEWARMVRAAPSVEDLRELTATRRAERSNINDTPCITRRPLEECFRYANEVISGVEDALESEATNE